MTRVIRWLPVNCAAKSSLDQIKTWVLGNGLINSSYEIWDAAECLWIIAEKNRQMPYCEVTVNSRLGQKYYYRLHFLLNLFIWAVIKYKSLLYLPDNKRHQHDKEIEGQITNCHTLVLHCTLPHLILMSLARVVFCAVGSRVDNRK